MITTTTIPPGQSVGQCPAGNHFAPVGRPEVMDTGRVQTHPTMPMLRDVCPGTGRLARVREEPRHFGYLVKVQQDRPVYVVWCHTKLPVAIFTTVEDLLDFGYQRRQIEAADRTGSSSQGTRHTGGKWQHTGLQVADWGWLLRPDLLEFSVALLVDRDEQAARRMLQIHRRELADA